MKYTFESQRQKKNKAIERFEESQIEDSKYKPNDKVMYKNKVFTLNYPDVIEGKLTWLASTKQGWFWLKEESIL
jgi:hypothetical protein